MIHMINKILYERNVENRKNIPLEILYKVGIDNVKNNIEF